MTVRANEDRVILLSLST